MKIIFFGLGSIGQRHAKILLNYYDHELFAFRTNLGQIDYLLPIKEVKSWDHFKEINPDIAFITNPTALHISTALNCAKENCSLFIEKPLGAATDNLNQLIEIIESENLVAYVAYNLRFHPIITTLKEYATTHDLMHLRVIASSYLPNWRTDQNYRDSYSSNSKMGGGVIFDLSHEIDYVSYLTDGIDEIHGRFSRASGLTVDTEDHADLLVKSKNCNANIHINFMCHYRERLIRADFKDFTLCADLSKGTLSKFEKEILTEVKDFNINSDFTYREQLDYFFKNQDSGMMNNIHDAAVLFRKIVNFKERRGVA